MPHTTQKSIEQIEQELLDQVVYMGFTKRELQEAFKLVENKTNWKLPIDAVLPAVTPVEELNKINAAIIFFSGGGAAIHQTLDGWRITAPGYYRNIGP